jgi:hypothetical protein
MIMKTMDPNHQPITSYLHVGLPSPSRPRGAGEGVVRSG